MSKTIGLHELGIAEAIPHPKRTDWRIGIVGYGGIAGAQGVLQVVWAIHGCFPRYWPVG